MNYILYFDYAALAINIFVFTVILIRKMYIGRTGRLLFWFVLVSFLCTIFDILGSLTEVGRITLYINNTFYFLFRITSGFMCGLFMIFMTENTQQISKNKTFEMLFYIPYTISVILVLTNPLTGFVFKIDENGIYTRGFLMSVLFVIGWGYLFLSVSYVIRYRKIFTRKNKFALLMIPVITIVPSIFQLAVKPNLLVEMFSTSINLLTSMLLCFNKNGQHSETGINNFQSFENNLKLALFSKEKHVHVLFKIEGYDAIKSIISFKEMYDICDEVSEKIVNNSRKILTFSNPYYLGKGLYVVSFIENSKNKVDVLINEINKIFMDITFKAIESSISFKNIIVRTPDDIDSVERFINLIEFVNNNEDKLSSYHDYRDLYVNDDFIIESEIHDIITDALANDKFEVFYQPIYSIQRDKIESVEALLRLKTDKYGYINPQLIVSAAENNGTINEIGLIVLEKACAFMESKEFSDNGLSYMEVNLSFNQLLNPFLPKSIIEITTKHHISPKQIIFEITESRNAFNLSIITKNISELVNMGFVLSLDDYGTGYSNIKRMMDIPFSIIKIDKSFVDSIGDEKMEKIVFDTIKLFKSIGYEIVVEGVETEKEYNIFKELNCEYIQGFYFSRPISDKDLVEFIKTRNA